MSAAGTVRSYLETPIKDAHAAQGWRIHGYPHIPAQVRTGAPVVSLWRSDMSPGSNSLELSHDVTINLYGAKTAGDAVEDDLDGLLDALMVTLQRLNRYTWSKASRIAWNDGTLAGWQITGTVSSPNIYREAIIKERENN